MTIKKTSSIFQTDSEDKSENLQKCQCHERFFKNKD